MFENLSFIKNLNLSKKKLQFVKNRTLLSIIFSVVLLGLLFLLCFLFQSSKNQAEYTAAMAARVNVIEEEKNKPSPVPIVEITEAPSVEHKDGEVNEDDEDLNIIYLTFDDGPGPYTEELLDILKAHNVKATFFVTGVFEEYTNLIKREYEEGHSVAIHSLTHDYDLIYSSSEAFWEDSDAMQKIIKEQTGHETKLMRFPGGSSNTVSRFNPGIMTQLVKEASQRGFSYFDWNVTSGDAGETTESQQVLANCKEGVQWQRISVILCHDVKDFTVNAMDEFITWALDNGYTFAPLTVDSFPSHHGVNN